MRGEGGAGGWGCDRGGVGGEGVMGMAMRLHATLRRSID